MPKKTKTDWKQIEIDIVHGIVKEDGGRLYLSLKEASERFGVNYDSLRQKASKGKWLKKRDAYTTKVSQKITEKKSEYDAECIVQSDEKFEATGEKLRQLVDISIDNDLERAKAGEPIKPYNMKMYGDAYTSAQSGVKAAQGEILEKSKLEIDDKTPKKQNNVFARVDSLMMFVEKGNDSNDDRELQSENPDNS